MYSFSTRSELKWRLWRPHTKVVAIRNTERRIYRRLATLRSTCSLPPEPSSVAGRLALASSSGLGHHRLALHPPSSHHRALVCHHGVHQHLCVPGITPNSACCYLLTACSPPQAARALVSDRELARERIASDGARSGLAHGSHLHCDLDMVAILLDQVGRSHHGCHPPPAHSLAPPRAGFALDHPHPEHG